MALLVDNFCPLLQVLISALRMSRRQVTWENSHFANDAREDLSNSVKMDLHSCASSLSTLPKNLCVANILSMWTIRLIFTKFPPLTEIDRMKGRNEDTGCALSLSHP